MYLLFCMSYALCIYCLIYFILKHKRQRFVESAFSITTNQFSLSITRVIKAGIQDGRHYEIMLDNRTMNNNRSTWTLSLIIKPTHLDFFLLLLQLLWHFFYLHWFVSWNQYTSQQTLDTFFCFRLNQIILSKEMRRAYKVANELLNFVESKPSLWMTRLS